MGAGSRSTQDLAKVLLWRAGRFIVLGHKTSLFRRVSKPSLKKKGTRCVCVCSTGIPGPMCVFVCLYVCVCACLQCACASVRYLPKNSAFYSTTVHSVVTSPIPWSPVPYPGRSRWKSRPIQMPPSSQCCLPNPPICYTLKACLHRWQLQ